MLRQQEPKYYVEFNVFSGTLIGVSLKL